MQAPFAFPGAPVSCRRSRGIPAAVLPLLRVPTIPRDSVLRGAAAFAQRFAPLLPLPAVALHLYMPAVLSRDPFVQTYML